MKIDLYNDDCLVVMEELIKQGIKVDAIITDPPYGTTACSWDSVIPFNNFIKEQKGKKEIVWYEKEWIERELETTYKSIHQCRYEFKNKSKDGMWQKLNKLIKPNGAIVLFGSEPFSSSLRISNIKNYKYDWKWLKSRTVGFLNAKNAPLKKNEDVIIFSNGKTANNNKNRMVYFPQGLIEVNKIKKSVSQGKETIVGSRTSRNKDYVVKYEGYPNNILRFKNENKQKHPTQKPVELMEYLIKTYTNEGDTVLDFTMGSGTTGVSCVNLNRNFIGIEKEEKYFEIAKKRINNNNLLTL